MVHRKKERMEQIEAPNVREIVSEIEKEIKAPSSRMIEEYASVALAKRTEEITKEISEKRYRKAHDDAKDLARCLDKGDPKYLNRW
ncbi:MAG: hypothetical protein ACP5JC_00260 [Candidatus Micrarchaeia archaeon]